MRCNCMVYDYDQDVREWLVGGPDCSAILIDNSFQSTRFKHETHTIGILLCPSIDFRI
jgi:hypothetical protein